jgi:hypothetical protein
VTVLAIGALASRALERSQGRAVPLAAFADAPYFDADGEIIWVGSQLPAMHPRAVMTAAPQPRGRPLRFAGWPAPESDAASAMPADAALLASRTLALRDALLDHEAPRGFGLLLAGRIPEFPLDGGAARVHDLAAAHAADDPEGVERATLALAGFGTGLTPSGDDLAGGALFIRRVLRPDAAWTALAERLIPAVAVRTHAISAALFADLARGASFAPLHDCAAALARGDAAAALAAARTLARIGHSSGWDMLTGCIIGLAGTNFSRAPQ